MNFCPICNSKVKEDVKICPECGEHLKTMKHVKKAKEDETFEVRPRFVFMYELLPSSLKTVWMLILLLIVTLVVRDYFHLPPATVVAFFATLFLLKDLQIFYRKFRYRNIKYIISNDGIEYIDMSSEKIAYFIPYDKMVSVEMGRNFATKLFGYGHILVRDGDDGIYLDYIADVEKVYEYIVEHMNK